MTYRQTTLFPVATVDESDDTDRIETIIKLHSEVRESMESVVNQTQNAFEKLSEIGKLLIEKKETLRHGRFGDWVGKYLPFTHRTANRYMELHRNWRELNLKKIAGVSEAYQILMGLKRREQSLLEGETKKLTRITIKPDSIEQSAISAAFNKAKEILDTDSMTAVIYHMASDWLEYNCDRTELPPIKEKTRRLEKMYDVKITIQPNEPKIVKKRS